MYRGGQLDGLLTEVAGGWSSTVIMVPSLSKAPILATGRLHGPLKFVTFAQELLFVNCECDGLWVLPLASTAAGLRRSAFGRA